MVVESIIINIINNYKNYIKYQTNNMIDYLEDLIVFNVMKYNNFIIMGCVIMTILTLVYNNKNMLEMTIILSVNMVIGIFLGLVMLLLLDIALILSIIIHWIIFIAIPMF